MTDNNTEINEDVQNPTDVDLQEEHEQPDYTVAEQQALARGWQPKEQWQGPEEDWVTAAEYNRRSQLFGKISNQRHEIEELRNAMRQMHNMLVKNTESGFNNAINSLKQERQQALQDGDTDKVMQLDQQLEATQQYKQQSTTELKNGVKFNQTPDFYREWKESNSWYGSNKRMTAYADAVARELLEQNPGMDKAELLKQVGEETQNQFNNRQSQGAMSSKSNTPKVLGTQAAQRDSGTTRGKGISSLSPSEQAIARTIMQTTGISEREYMKQYSGN